jgi:hypothetical protein
MLQSIINRTTTYIAVTNVVEIHLRYQFITLDYTKMYVTICTLLE